MPALRALRVIGALAVALMIMGCGFTSLGEAGGRRLVFPVANRSAQPVSLIVAEDPGRDRKVVGRATPDRVPAGAVVDVAFDVPPGTRWGIYINPGPDGGWYMVTATDVPPGAAGKVPLKIDVGPDGEPSVSAPSEPGWFGN